MEDPNLIKEPKQNTAQNTEPKMAKEPEAEEYQFFNVMPKEKEAGKIVEPQIQIQSEKPLENTASGYAWAKYKLYIIVGILLLVAAPGVYFLVSKLGESSYKPESFLVDQNENKNKQDPASENQSNLDFKTPEEWRNKYFPDCADAKMCGDDADPDNDGLTNLQEQELDSDPNNNDSDQDGLADGDEVAIFQSSPTENHTAKDPQYSDADFVKGGYDLATNKLMDAKKIAELSDKMKTLGLHQPTFTTLLEVLPKIYNFTPQNNDQTASSTPTSTSSALSGLDVSVEAKQDRDTQRSGTIKNLEVALVKYYSDNQAYPAMNDFTSMYNMVKPYLKVATNPIDPVNKDIYIYSYLAESGGKDFTLSFYSEVAGQLIKKHAVDAQKDAQSEQAGIYDDQRKNDLENLRSALLIYSNKNIAGTQEYVFPSPDKFSISLVPEIVSVIPKDPKTSENYLYQVSETFNTFTLKALLDSPPVGTSGYLCNQEECRNY